MASSDLRKLARGRPCVLCNTGQPDDTTVLAHISVGGNHGMGLKASDWNGVWLCAGHHRWFDTDGRADWKTKLIALTRQLVWYEREGVL